VVAIEKDKRLIKLWQTQIPKPENLTVIEADACNFDYAHLAKEIGGKLFVFGNLPFNVSTLILERLFHEWQHMAYAQLTFQKEVAERLQAKPSTKDYGSLTIFAQVYCNVKPQMVIQKQQYFPVPKIDSKVLGFEFLAQPRVALEDLKDFEAFTRQLFLYRRKTLLNGARLSKRFAPYHQKLKENLVARGLSETVRVETLDLNTLYELFRSIKPQHPDK
jgi:16S rRNA (adenine1518-N6/adenine1519-N6)-dimethyltransferase